MHKTAKQAAMEYLEKGWKPIPVPHKEKSPNRKGWQKLEVDEEFIETNFNDHEQNLGVLLGQPSASLVDVDLDSIEAVEIAERFLPETGAIFGRQSKPRSHWLYVSEDSKTEQFQDPVPNVSETETNRKRATIVEIRFTGAQTVFPPSTHSSGEAIEWTCDGEPARFDSESLRKAVCKLAAASLVAKYWKSGIRQDAAMALSGILLRAGWSVDDVEKFVESVAIAANDDESASRISVVRHTADSLGDNKPVTGIPRLKELIPREVVERVCDWLSLGSVAPEKLPHCERLLDLSEGIDLFNFNGVPYASVPIKGHWETMRIESKTFRQWLQYKFFKEEGRSPTSQALQDAVGVLTGKAMFEGKRREVFLRIAFNEKKVYLDLCNEQWQVVEISEKGWKVIESVESPVRFRRTKSMLALPYPIAGSSLEDLRHFVNVTDRDFVLLQAWLIAAFRPGYPFTILILSGTQGSAKSTTTSVLQSLIDPTVASRRSTPSDERNLAILANNSWVVAFDNMSFCKQWLSDALCRLATGGSLSTRTLYENDEETLFTAMRPIILNGIEDIATRADLLERSLLVQLPKIESKRRFDQESFDEAFEAFRPQLLGAILDAVSEGLSQIDSVEITNKPRMADFAKLATAAEGKFHFPLSLDPSERSFLVIYEDNLRSGQTLAVESSPLVKVITDFLGRVGGKFRGTATELRDHLILGGADLPAVPKNGRALSSALRRLADPLLSIGVKFSEGRETDKNRTRFVALEKLAIEQC